MSLNLAEVCPKCGERHLPEPPKYEGVPFPPTIDPSWMHNYLQVVKPPKKKRTKR